MNQTERIREMECRLEYASAVVMEMSASLDKYIEAQGAIEALSEYYGSDDWKRDYADDEACRLPAGLKRGVLSEDGVWNLLADNRELKTRMAAIVIERT